MLMPSEIFASNMLIQPSHSTSKPLAQSFGNNTASYQIVKVFPRVGTTEASVMEEVVFKAIVKIEEKNLDRESIEVDLWTNVRHLQNGNGNWHMISLPYRGSKDGENHVFGQVVVLVEDGLYEFIFKAKTLCEKIGSFYPMENSNSQLLVQPPRKLVLYAQVLRVPYMSQIIGPLWAGNEWAGLQSRNNEFTHVMCLAEELPTPFEDMEGICFCKVPFTQGVANPINPEAMKRAVIWIKKCMRDGFRVLIYSKHGFARTGSIIVGFVMRENVGISFEDALQLTFERRPVLPHRNLKVVCDMLYNRPKSIWPSETIIVPKTSSNFGNL